MRKLLAAAVLSLLAAVAVPTMALGTHSTGPGPKQDLISGDARGPTPVPCPPGTAPSHFHANARALDNLTNVARGQFFNDIRFNPPCLGFTSASISGQVVCLNAYQSGSDNSANWAGVIQFVLLEPGDVPGIPGLLFPGMGVVARHIDNGSPGVGKDRAISFTTPAPAPCLSPLLSTPFSTLPITQGNLIVHRAT